jgi:phosphatidylglycerophosphatase A
MEYKKRYVDHLSKVFLSFFFVGYLPIAPGTWGTLATIPLLYLFHLHASLTLLIISTLLITIVSCFITDIYQRKHDLHDPGWIVIDEVAGMMTTYCFVMAVTNYFSPASVILSFIFFRIFDIVKLWPASFFDKKMTHGAGVILDDIISGIYVGLLFLGLRPILKYYIIFAFEQ